mmetsp:Transcript_26440/g.31249  ORF Transcript_26440/g.31249 Transcript_26440/m.31249 type:complete len:141 (+) Transcript_26440:57-479(+)
MSRSRSPAPDKFGAIKRSLQHAVGEIAQHENRTNNQLPISGAGVATLTEVVFKYIESVASDLRSFSKHGKRATVTCDDVKLIARKVPELLTDLEEYEEANMSEKKKRKTTEAASSSSSSSSSRPRLQNPLDESDEDSEES